MKKTTLGLLSLVAATAFAAPAHAQIPNISPFSFEVRGGLALPSGELKDEANAQTGYTVGANATFHLSPLLGIYGGYTYNRFGVDLGDLEEEVDEDVSVDVVDQGFNAGVRVAIPTPLIPIDPYLKAGAVFNKVGFAGDDVDGDDFESDNSLGFEIGAGVGIGLGPKLSFTPQVTYTSYKPKFDGESDDESVDHIRLDVGLRIRL
ncbi:MAG TPA: outer membrane beta-barrel protein [Longimicrobium sp.]|jgi:opacity protein-like surface antigen